jgi:hypothetical protein
MKSGKHEPDKPSYSERLKMYAAQERNLRLKLLAEAVQESKPEKDAPEKSGE